MIEIRFPHFRRIRLQTRLYRAKDARSLKNTNATEGPSVCPSEEEDSKHISLWCERTKNAGSAFAVTAASRISFASANLRRQNWVNCGRNVSRSDPSRLVCGFARVFWPAETEFARGAFVLSPRKALHTDGQADREAAGGSAMGNGG